MEGMGSESIKSDVLLPFRVHETKIKKPRKVAGLSLFNKCLNVN